MTKQMYFVPLGGVGEIGMNLALYGYGAPGKMQWVIVDCGVTFADFKSPGIELIMPDIRFITEDRQALLGLILTHGHEDHIGAVLDLYPQLNCKVFATKFTAGLLAAKAAEDGRPLPKIDVVKTGDTVNLGPFEVTYLSVAHSIPESHALGIVTPAGRVIHTGDWKIDPTPPLGDATDMGAFARFARDGVDVLIGDSTNAPREGRSPSEQEVGVTLTKIIKAEKNRAAVTLFASNIARIHSIALAAQANGRSVVLFGRSLHRNVQVAKECGYLQDLPPFLDMDMYQQLPRNNIVAIMTGSQGEDRSALARVARKDHPHVSLAKGDLVIFSSRTIPGNEKPVANVVNGLVRQGVHVLTDRTHLVHVSGHPRVDEIAELYNVVKPKALIPVHGEPYHLQAHAELGQKLGIKDVKIIEDRQMVRLTGGPLTVIDEVPGGRLYKDGNLLLPEEDSTLSERRRLQMAGMVSVAVCATNKGELASDIEISLTGVPKTGMSGDDMYDIVDDAVRETFHSLPRARKRDFVSLREALMRSVRGAVDQEWGKKPWVEIHIMEI
jgi:ribonuclease J